VIIPAEGEPRELSAASTILLAAALLPLGMTIKCFLALLADEHREQDRHHDAIRADVLGTISEQPQLCLVRLSAAGIHLRVSISSTDASNGTVESTLFRPL